MDNIIFNGPNPVVWGIILILTIHAYHQFVWHNYGHWYFDVAQRLIDTLDVLVHGKRYWIPEQEIYRLSLDRGITERKAFIEISSEMPPYDQFDFINKKARDIIGRDVVSRCTPVIHHPLDLSGPYVEFRYFVVERRTAGLPPLYGDEKFTLENLSRHCINYN